MNAQNEKAELEKVAKKVYEQIKRDIDHIVNGEEEKQEEGTETEIWDWAIRNLPTKPGVRCSPTLQRIMAA